jgi:SAM-dependent MidA family methyltransferase
VNALGRRIAGLTVLQGPLSVAQFMTLALHDPLAGYYATRSPLGARGDFITAPEISQMFGELIGLWCVQAWRDQGEPAHTLLVELGPGRGTLMTDALRAARLAPDFLSSIEVVLVEASPVLRAVQKERLGACGVPIRWEERFEENGRPLLVVANEFFDALPIRQFVRTTRGWCERMVVADADGALAFTLAPEAFPFIAQNGAPLGAVRELAPSATSLVGDIARSVAHHGGAALIVDYGYGEPGNGETLQAVGRHSFADVLTDPGCVDISAHVDFAALAAAAAAGGAIPYGPISQRAFLERLGIGARAETLMRLNPSQSDVVAQARDRLVAPEQMGALFKVLAILPRTAPQPPGFAA